MLVDLDEDSNLPNHYTLYVYSLKEDSKLKSGQVVLGSKRSAKIVLDEDFEKVTTKDHLMPLVEPIVLPPKKKPKTKSEYLITLSLLIEEPKGHSSWQTQKKFKESFSGLFDQLSLLYSLEFESQIIYYTDLSIAPSDYNETHKAIGSKQLPLFVNEAGWNLGLIINLILLILRNCYSKNPKSALCLLPIKDTPGSGG